MEDITRVFDLLDHNNKSPKADIVAGKKNGKWRTYSTAEFIELIDAISRGLLAYGIKSGDKVAIMSPNRPEWNICDFGIMQTGATQVPMYPTLSEKDIQFILQDAEVKMIFVADRTLAEKINVIKKSLQSDLSIFTYDEVEDYPNWVDVINKGKQNQSVDLTPHKAAVKPDDLLTLIYTSGTTGTPKGVMLTHNNLMSNFLCSSPLDPKDFKKALSF
ncbi:MAG TPA: AMP-binding protein, partial [Sphingobacteriaceae bacterium]